MEKSIKKNYYVLCYLLYPQSPGEPLEPRWPESNVALASSPAEAVRKIIEGTRPPAYDAIYTVRWADEVWLFHRKAGEDV